MAALTWGFAYFRQPFSKKTPYLVNRESDQKSITSKKDAKFNSLSGVSSDLMYLQPLWFYYKSKQNNSKTQKNPLSHKR